jgi:hypothetical protein
MENHSFHALLLVLFEQVYVEFIMNGHADLALRKS